MVTDAAPLVNRPPKGGPCHPVLGNANVAVPDLRKTAMASAGVEAPLTPGAMSRDSP